MRMNLRTEECRERAAECAEKALCAFDRKYVGHLLSLLSNGGC